MGQLDVSDLLADRQLRGPDFCEALTERIDGFLTGVYAAAEAPEGTFPQWALGGYGRREQCPGSDVDVVLVHRPERTLGRPPSGSGTRSGTPA
ncbi:MAG: hypothetical protein Ct9H300mP31_03220 [Acidimicrobiaceae bacterium]|nr:MAG: hypothetical protein Ct9H300mP31_03220 [Acidimicrobiaceae bacterium]